MKKMNLMFAFAILAFASISCDQLTKTLQLEKETVTAMDSVISDGHNSSNALDVEGEYKGMLPCANCEAIKTVIVLNSDKSYIRHTTYRGKDVKVFEETGVYSWNSEGNTITLSGIKNGPNMYFVGENKLIQLDMDGKRITGNMADKYVLHK